MGSAWQRDKLRTEKRRAVMDAHPPHCDYCGSAIPKPRRYTPGVRYCNEKCKTKNKNKRALERAKELDAVTIDQMDVDDLNARMYGPRQTRTGPEYDTIKRMVPPDVIDAWVDRKLTNNDIKQRYNLKTTTQNLSLIRNQLFNDRLVTINTGKWEPKLRYRQMLGPDDEYMRNLAESTDPTDQALFDQLLDVLVHAFVSWRDEFFSTSRGAYITKAFHRRWIKETLRTIYLGGRLQILSPPRHGKTDLLIHFSVWLICRNPMIRILWVGPNEDIGKNCLGMVKEILSSHDELKDAFLAPGIHWAPQKRGGLWAADKFTIDNRPMPQKQPTMWSTGVGGRILSLDADFIIVDDPADPDASYTQGGRDKIDNWFKVKLASRKMDFTGLVMISSRVHPEDLYSQFVDHPRWVSIVDQAHQGVICGLDMFTQHPDESCVLFPEINPLRYLREQADVVGMPLFEMMYLNQPRPTTAQIYNIALIRDLCIDKSRVMGTRQIPGHFRLVAGLDPAAAGTQAAFCWAVSEMRHPERADKTVFLYSMVDSQTQKAGGIEGALAVMRQWHTEYGLRLWVVEDNAYQKVFFRDPRVKGLTLELGLDIKATHTDHRTKYDPRFGVASMAPDFHEGRVILPYGDPESRRKVDSYLRSLAKITTDEGPAKKGSDEAMASWFPFATVIRRWTRELQPENSALMDPARSYPGYGEVSYDSPPWGGTDYPY